MMTSYNYTIVVRQAYMASPDEWEVEIAGSLIPALDRDNAIMLAEKLAEAINDHTQLRAALTESLSPRALRGLKSQIDARADTLVADLVEQGTFDAIDSIARALPLDQYARGAGGKPARARA